MGRPLWWEAGKRLQPLKMAGLQGHRNRTTQEAAEKKLVNGPVSGLGYIYHFGER
jgi:hypothetical protein